MNIEKWLNLNTSSLSGKTVVITGATGGLGSVICRYILKLNGKLILLNRSRKKTENLCKDLYSKFPHADIKIIYTDFEDIQSVKAACEQLYNMPIDFLIHNAGAYSIPRKTCSTGFDNVFQINFVVPYYITKQLLDKLAERGGRVIAVGSIAHNYSKTDSMDIDFSTRKKASLVYGNSKRYLMFSLFELIKENPSVQLCVVHPGITFTNITAHYPKLIFAVIKYPMKVIFMKTDKAALSIVKGLFEKVPYSFWIGPRFFDVWGKPAVKELKTADYSERKRIYKTAEQIYNQISEGI